ncbi:MAG: YraN family protein [Natronospirillum sp.]
MSLAIGLEAEAQCADYLRSQGLKLLARNVKCRLGELDLIMQEGNVLVFVEVKARRSNHFGGGLAAVTASKQQKLRRAAQWYLMQQHKTDAPCRFDVVDVNLNTQEFNWIRNAF